MGTKRQTMLTQRQVSRYVRLNALVSRATKKRNALRDEIVAEMKRGAVCPSEGPFILEYTEVLRRPDAWKELAYKLARRFKARKLLDKWHAALPQKPVDTLNIRRNPDYECPEEELAVDAKRKRTRVRPAC
jgi:hypothetical protein